MSGRLTIVLRDRSGRVVAERRVDNLITTAGKTLMAELFTGAAQGKPELAIAVGGGGNAAAVTDTGLQSRLDEAAAGTPAVKVVTEGNQPKIVATVTATLPALSGEQQQALQEAGIVLKLPNREPVLYNRVTFPTVTRTSSLDITLTWEVSF